MACFKLSGEGALIACGRQRGRLPGAPCKVTGRMTMEIRKATKSDCRAIAGLALIAGEGIPAYFWERSKKPGQQIEDVGAQNAASERHGLR